MSEAASIRIEDPTEWAYVALGSNLGNSQQIIKDAIERLSGISEGPVVVSSLWQTTPVDCPPGSPPFINAVIGLKPLPGETPERLLVKLQNLEQKFGRKPKIVLNEARTLDLDLIAFRKEIRMTPELTLPHPQAHRRRFVLQPLSELAPGLVLSGQTKMVAELLGELPPDAGSSRLGTRG